MAGNYGEAWWQQRKEFERFNGPVLLTTNCLMPPKGSYLDRVYTTGVVRFPDIIHIEEGSDGTKDFSAIIEHAERCNAPTPMEDGELTIKPGKEHIDIPCASKLLELASQGKISRFIVMAGCDDRHSERQYYTGFAAALPDDMIILIAGCAKYRFNKLSLGDIEGIPRVVDAGQCNVVLAGGGRSGALAEVLGMGINELPISYNVLWYEQKAVLVLQSLLSIGVRDMMLVPKLPAFLSPNVLKVLVDKFNIRANTTVDQDLLTIMAGN